jgi:methionyl-tRNA synthetase
MPDPTIITIEKFSRINMRIARIEKAELIDGADKLLKLTLGLGGGTYKVFSGIKSAYKPKVLGGKLFIAVSNLQPRKMRFGVSEGIILTAGSGNKDIFLLSLWVPVLNQACG